VAVVVRADARRELESARDYIEQQRSGYGFLFAEAVERELKLLEQFPLIGKPLPGRKFRKRSLPDWSHSLYYFVDRGDVVVVACVHYRRDPNAVRRRLR
jgi:plasmid stabilization system protein ParE